MRILAYARGRRSRPAARRIRNRWPTHKSSRGTCPSACAKRTTRVRWSCASAPTSRSRSTPASSSRRSRSPTRPTATLNAARSNAVLICHALTGDQHVANVHPVTGKPGWWETMVGPASRSTPSAISSSAPTWSAAAWARPARPRPIRQTGKPWGLDFPVITIRDMVRAQAMLLDHLGIEQLFCGGRRLDGRHAGAAMGGELSASACSRRCRSPPRRAIRRRTSPSTRSAARR